jgi:hypothetical protein
MLGSENVRDDDVVEKAGDGPPHVSIALALALARVGFHTECRFGGYSDTCACRARVVVCRGFRCKIRRGSPKTKTKKMRIILGKMKRASPMLTLGVPMEPPDHRLT